MAEKGAAGSKWILRPPGMPPLTNPKLRLFCIPQAGSGAWVYQEWQRHVPSGVEVLPIELPGRNTRMKEPLLKSMPELVAGILQAITPLLHDGGVPFAFFGHSLGGWIAYSLVQELQQQGGDFLPLSLFVSGVRAPQLAGVAHDPDGIEMHKLNSTEFWEAMERRYGRNPDLMDPSVRKLMQPILQADFAVSETYRPALMMVPLPCSLFFYGGSEDPRLRRDQVEKWRETVSESSQATITWFPGGHNYLFRQGESKAAFLDDLVNRLQQLLLEISKRSEATPFIRVNVQYREIVGRENGQDGVAHVARNSTTVEGGGVYSPASVHSATSEAAATVGSGSSYIQAVGAKTASIPGSEPQSAAGDVVVMQRTQGEGEDAGEPPREEKQERKNWFGWLCIRG